MFKNKRLMVFIVVLGIASLFVGYSILAQRSGVKISASSGKSKSKTAKSSKQEQKEQAREKVFKLDPNADPNPKGPISMTADAFGVTPPIRDLEEFRNPPKPFKGKIKIEDKENNEVEIDRIIPEAWADDWKAYDPLAEKSREAAKTLQPEVMPGPALTFDGVLSNNLLTTFGTTSMPPDTVGDVGPNHYVQSTNIGVFQIYNKTGTPIGSTTRISTFFSGLPAGNKCRTRDNGDVVINYDPMADRWLISQFAISDDGADIGTPFYQCMAISQTGDPTGAYFAYAFKGPNNNFPDYPHWGVWTDGYYLAVHEFNDVGTAYVQGGFFAFNRDKMLAGDPTANFIYFSVAASFGHLPADIDGYMPPAAGTPQMFFRFTADEFGGTDSIISYDFVPNYTTPASSTFTTKPALAVASFDPRNPTGRLDIEQPSPATASHNLDVLGTNVMFRVGYRNLGTIASPTNSYVMNWNVNVSGVNPTTAGTYQSAIRWEELRRSGAGAMSVFDQGTHAPDPVSGTGRNRWMGSIAQDNNGNLALGFSRSGPSVGQNPDIVWAGRTGGIAAAGTMNEGEATMFASTGVQSATNSRWGDYSNMNVDPADDCTFWYTQEYRDSVNNGTGTNNPFKWSTRIGNFKFPSCTNAPKGQVAVNVTSCSSGAPINDATVTSNPGGFFRKTNSSGNLVSNIMAAPGSYTVNASKNGVSATPQGIVVSNGVTTSINMCIAGPIVTSGTATILSESCSPANNAVDPGETVTVSLPVQNIVAPNTSSLKGTLQRTGGVVGVGASQTYGVVSAGGSSVSQTFTFVADPDLNCGSPVTLSMDLADGATNLGTVTYTLPASTTQGSATTINYSGAATAIPDNNANGVNTTIGVSGVGNIADLDFRINGTSATAGSSGIDHTFVGDLVFKLTSPQGTTTTIIKQIDSGGGDGQCGNDNFFNTVLDDEAAGGVLVDNNCTAGMTGSFRPAIPLSLFDGENPNGTWTLNVADLFTTDTGTIRAYGLVITPFSCCTSQRRWTGVTSTDWNTASNWNPSGVPTAGETAIIPSTGVTNEPNISAANVSISGIILASNRTLTITSPRTLTVTNSSVIKGIVNVTGGVTLNTFADLNDSTFNYNGAAAQSLTNVSYDNLTINNAAGASLSGSSIVDGTLTMTNGILNTGGNTLTVSCTGTSSGGSTSSFVNGNLRKDYCGSGSFSFPVGTTTSGNEFSPMTANVTVLATNPSSLTVTTTRGIAPATPALSSGITLNRFWTLTETGDLTANLTFNYLQTDVNGTESNYRIYRLATGGGSAPLVFPNGSPCPGAGSPCVDTTANTMFIGGVGSFSNWTAGGLAPTGASATVSGRVLNAWGGMIGNAIIELTIPGNPTPRITISNMFGYYRFTDIPVGENYVLTVKAKRYVFSQPSQLLNVNGDVGNVDFIALP